MRTQGHSACRLCRSLPDRVSERYIGAVLTGDPLPAAARQLEVIGAPLFSDDPARSRSCLKRCPQCGTYYSWKMNYLSLPDGDGEEVILTRLEPEDGEQRAQDVQAIVQETNTRFIADARYAMHALQHYDDPGDLERATAFILGGLLRCHDITFAVPDLITTLERLSPDPPYDIVVSRILLIFTKLVRMAQNEQDAASIARIRDQLLAAGLEQHQEALQPILNQADKLLGSLAGG
nr:hypothetical protein [Anaerolineae bacterium]